MSSPNINNIINLNCILLYFCPIFNSIKGLNLLNEPLGNSMCQVFISLLIDFSNSNNFKIRLMQLLFQYVQQRSTQQC